MSKNNLINTYLAYNRQNINIFITVTLIRYIKTAIRILEHFKCKINSCSDMTLSYHSGCLCSVLFVYYLFHILKFRELNDHNIRAATNDYFDNRSIRYKMFSFIYKKHFQILHNFLQANMPTEYYENIQCLTIY